ncbi:segregation/condensation protein A [Myxococcota bacterium]|nr:segregation/condensation protein A [Myxococcota bacterium]MBU1535738.1 segregation/condensation protein A [Myxococcota bacterium]
MESDLTLSPDLDVQLEELFSGPFDLLLHLVRKHELDLREIPLGFLAEKYVEALTRLRELNIDIATDFLVIAATLVEWKSRVILPRAAGEPEGDEEDPAAVIAQRLLLYRKFRRAAAWLYERTAMETPQWRRGSPIVLQEESAEELEAVPLSLLAETLMAILPREGNTTYGRSSMVKELSLHERVSQILETLEREGTISFSRVLSGITNQRLRVIVLSFLAVLELSHLGLATICQDENGGEIQLVLTDQQGA